MTAPTVTEAARNRHDPSEPKNFMGELTERTAGNGSKYFYGFVGSKKYLMLPSRIPGVWRLYWQGLDAQPKPQEPSPYTSPPTQPREPEGRLPFVSGLPD